MFDFKLFNVPVRVEPWFWLTVFLLGGGFRMEIERQALLAILLFMIIAFVSILVHEFGHALTSRKFTKVNPSVKLWAMGGLAYPNTNLTRKESFWVTWAGPLAGFAFFGVVLLTCCFVYGFDAGSRVIAYLIYPNIEFLNLGSILVFQKMDWVTYEILSSLVFINFWWSFLNLLPVYPLDGGQIYAAVEKSQRRVFQVGIVAGVAAAIAFFLFERYFAGFLFGFLAYQNYQRFQMITGYRR